MKKYNLDFSPKTEAFPHQVEAIEFIKRNNEVALFDEMGLGKTKIVIDALSHEIKEKKIDCVLVVCKKTLIKNWEEEIRKHTNLPVIILRGGYKEKGMKFLVYAPFYIINYESVVSEIKRLGMLFKIKKFGVVLDESHKIKDPHSKSTESLFLLAPLAKKKILVSGTPVANRPYDLWAQFYFLDGGRTLGTDFKSFKKNFTVNLRENYFNELKMTELRALIDSVAIRRLKKDVLALPNKKLKEVYVELNGTQREMYEQLKEKLVLDIIKMNGEEISDNAEHILKRLLRLTQVAANPKLIDNAYAEEPAKFTKLDNLVKKIILKNEKVIIWTSFIENILLLKKRYSHLRAVTIFGKMTIDERNKMATRFNEDPLCKVLVANPASAREGLTLTAANNAIYLDRSFNLVDYVQSQDRIHRISQKKECFVTNLLAKDTIDRYVDEIIYKKQNLARYIQGDCNRIMPSREFLTKEELLQMLGGRK